MAWDPETDVGAVQAGETARLLAKLGDGHWHCFGDRLDRRLAEHLVAAGRLVKRPEAHESTASLYRLPHP